MASYAGRQVDLLVMQLTPADSGSVPVGLSFGDIAQSVAGIQKASQKFLVTFLTRRGTAINDVKAGTNFLTYATSGRLQDNNEFESLVSEGIDETIDYLQKVPMEGAASLDRAPEVAASLKEIAMTDHVAVLAIAAVGHDGLGQRRIRPQHLASSAPLIHEADCAIVMNDKAPAISRVHTAFDGRQIEEAKLYTLFTIEKHRDGPADVTLEFAKEFESFRFNPEGAFVAEHLVDDISYSD